MSGSAPAESVDEVAVRGIAARMQEVLAQPGAYLSFPLAPIAYLAEDLRFVASGGPTAAQARTMGEFAELVNRIPLVSPVWADDASGRHLWDVYGEVLGAELAVSERTPDEEQAFQRAYSFLFTVMPEPPDAPSPALLGYRAAQCAYLAAEADWRGGQAGPNASALQAAKDQAWQAWRFASHADAIEEAMLTFGSLSDKDPSITWTRYRTQFDPGMTTSFQTAPSGQRYVTTGFAPSAALDVPWTRITMDRGDLDSAAASAAPELAAALAGSAATGSIKGVAFEFTAVDVTRPWLDVGMLTSRAWRFRSGVVPLSDGAAPPTGRCPALVTRLVFARNISVTRRRPAGGSEESAPTLAFLEPRKAFMVAQARAGMEDAAAETLIAAASPIKAVEPAVELVGQLDAQPARRFLRVDSKESATMAIGPAVFARPPEHELQLAIEASALAVDREPAVAVVRGLAPAVERVVLEPRAAIAIDRVQRFDFPTQWVPVADPPAAAPPAPEDEVVTTPAEAIFVMALQCRLLGTAPNPDPTLPWPAD